MIETQKALPKPEQIALVQGLFVQHTPKLRGFVVAICPDLSLVDDLVQETFMTVTEKAGQFVAGTNFMAWACTIARNKVMSACRRQKRHSLLSPEVLESVCACAPDEDALAPTLPHLEACLNRLSPSALEIVEMRYLQAHKPQDIARHKGWTAAAVHVALSRARSFLKSCVQKRLSLEAHS